MSLSRYKEYKDSGVEWLGMVPKHWEIKPLFSICIENKFKNKNIVENNLLSLSYGEIVRKDITSNEGLLPESFETYQIIKKGYIILRLTDLQNDKKSLRSAIAQEDGIITSAYTAIKITSVNCSYINFLLRAYDLIKVFYSMGGGLRQSLKFSDLKNLSVTIPPIEEQRIIAAFLDRETSKIDSLISEQEKLIELLKEKRQAIISHAVTKGLNPDAEMKDSGVEWLGKVPKHWSISQVKHLFHLGRGRVISSELLSDKGLYPVYSSQTLNDGCFGYIDTYDYDSEQITWTTDGANAGTIFLRSGKYNCTNVCGTLSLKYTNFHLKYGMYYLGYATQFYKRPDTNGAKIMNNEMASVLILMPELDEQSAIISFLDHETAKIDELTKETFKVIELLKERRSALISAAVTGQIDVRNFVPKEAA